ncbi:Gfo/Idh/MocA family oxidoreductase [bacterium]|nr:Gfo/Idh/MocA family oxidoreductase [bacterium]
MKRILLVGLGRFGANHLRVLKELSVPLGLVDVDAAALEKAGKVVPGAALAKDVRDLLPDALAASVVVPAHLHRPVATVCLEAGVHVFCEKPLAPTLEDARALAELADAKGCVLQTGFIFRHHPATIALRGLISRGTIGRPIALQAKFTGFKRPRTDGGCATNDAIHFVDLATAIFGKPPLSALAVTRDFLATGNEDVAFLTFDHGPELVHLEAGYHTPERARRVLVIGDAGSIAVDYDSKEPVLLFRQSHRKKDGQWVADEVAPEKPPVEPGEPLRRELEDFLANVREKRRPAADGWAGAQATAAIETALRSAREGRSLPVPRVGPTHVGLSEARPSSEAEGLARPRGESVRGAARSQLSVRAQGAERPSEETRSVQQGASEASDRSVDATRNTDGGRVSPPSGADAARNPSGAA